MMTKVAYKEPANYFPEELMKELMEDGIKNRKKADKEKESDKQSDDTEKCNTQNTDR